MDMNKTDQKDWIVILSACNGNSEQDDHLANISLGISLGYQRQVTTSIFHGRAVPVNGCYKGKTEKAYLVVIHNTRERKILQDLAFQVYGQESILERGNDGVFLHYRNGMVTCIGDDLIAVDESIAKQQDAYTERDGIYYIVR